MSDPSNNSLQHSSNQNIFSTIFFQQRDPSNTLFGLWTPLLNDTDSDEEMVDADENLPQPPPLSNIVPGNMTIQTMNQRMRHWSPRYRYIPLINNFINK